MMTMRLSLCLRGMKKKMITKILSFLSVEWGFNICTIEEQARVDGQLFICSPVLYYHLWS